MKPIDINPADMDIVLGILRDLAPEIEVRAFGSRVAWSARETSDLDLALMTDEQLPTSRMADLREAFSESDLPFKVDLIDWAATSENFRKIIEREYVVVQTKEWQKHGSEKAVGLKLPPKDNQEHRSNRSDWISTTVGSFCPFLYGKGLPENKRNKNGNFKVYGSNGPVGTHDIPLVDGPGIVIGRKGTVGVIHFSPNSFWPIDTTFFVGDETERDLRFTYYLLKSIGLEHMNADSAVPGLNRDAAHAKRIQIPKYSEQQDIAHILGTLDDKIELNRQINETLETIARTLFKSWFVDFDPVRAKMEGRQPAGMNSKLAALFPDSFDDSELGEIPKGWLITSLQNEIQVTKGRSYRSSELAASKVALVTLKSIKRGGGYRADGLKPFTGTYKREQIIAAGELVVAYTDVTQAAEVIGKPAIVHHDWQFDKLVASLDLAIVRPTARLSVPYLFCLFREPKFQDHAYAHTTGTTVLHLEKSAIPSYMTTLPPSKLCKEFKRITSSMFEEIEANASESKCLSALREGLLAPLVSGQMTPHLSGVQSDD